jgi:WD40 repeat protein
VRIEPELVEEVLDEVSTGRIEQSIAGVGAVEGTARAGRIETPYLQLVLQRLWEVERGQGSEVMRLETFRSLGGAERIVQDHLERAMRALSPAERAAAASVFGHLVTPSGTKIAHGTSDLATYAELKEGEIRPVLDSLARQRILRPLGENGHVGGRYEIFHDVLAGAVLAWSTRHEADLALEEERKRRRRLGWLAAAAFVGLVLMAALAAYAFSQRSEAQKQSEKAQDQRKAAVALAVQRQDALEDARKAQALAQRRTRQAKAQQARATAADEDAQRQAKKAQEANEDAQQQKQLAISGKKDAEEAREDAQAAQADAEEQARLAEVARERAKDAARNATIARDKAREATKQARARAYIARSVLLVRTDPEKSAISAVLATEQSTEPAIQIDAENALRAALVAMRGTHILPGAGADSARGASFSANGRGADSARVARFSANGRRIVVAGPGARGLRIYRARDGRLLKTFPVGTQLNDAVLSPDGKVVAAAGADGRVWVWDVASGTLRHFNHEAPVLGVAWSPAGDVLASWGVGASPLVRLWDPATGAPLHSLQHSAPLEAAIFSPNGERIASYGGSRFVRIFNVRSGIELAPLEHPDNGLPVTSAAFSPGGGLIATSRGNFARIWDVDTGVERFVSTRHTGTVTDVAFSPTGDQLVTGSIDTIARIFDTTTGELVATHFGHTGLGINDVDFSPDADTHAIVTAGADGTLRYSAPGQNSIALLGHDDAVLRASFSPDGRSILSASADGTARLWDPYGEPAPKTLKKYGEDVTAVAVDPTRSRIAVGRDTGGVEVLSPGGQVISTPISVVRPMVSVGWADETTLMAATDVGRVRIWADFRQRPMRELQHLPRIRSAAISQNGRLVATAGLEGIVRLWRLPGGTDRPLEHDVDVRSVAFDPSGRLLAAASGMQVYLWRTSDGDLLDKLDPGNEGGVVTGVAFGDGGRLLATSDRNGIARIWSVRSGKGKLLNTLVRHGTAIAGLSFSPDGRWLATAAARKVGVWQVGPSDLDGHFLFFVAPPRGQQGTLTSVAFSRNRTILMGSGVTDGVSYGAVRSYRCQLCGRLPQLLRIAKGRLAHLQAEARR